MSVVGTHHESLLYAAMEVLCCAALSQNDALQEACQERTASTLLRLRARLFVIEDGKHLCYLWRLLSALQESLEACMNHAEVVESSAGDELVVDSESTSWCGVGKVEVEVENVLLLDFQLFAN